MEGQAGSIEFIPLDILPRKRAAFLMCYPEFDYTEFQRRIDELRRLEVEGIEIRGKHTLQGIQILGKGNVGLVIAARVGARTVALKVRRIDADRSSMMAEAQNLRLANTVNVGPQLLASSENFILMELVEGEYLHEWLNRMQAAQSKTLKRALRNLLDDARRLDEIGLDHGELSNAHHHLILTDEGPMIIDFETASAYRKASNVTSMFNYLFFTLRRETSKHIHLPGRRELIEALKEYKSDPGDENYQNLLLLCGF